MKLKTTFSALGLVMLFAVGFESRSDAAPILYTIDFTLISGPPAPTSGSFDYNSTAAPGFQFTNFVVDWDGFTFNFTAAANAATVTDNGCPTPTAVTIFDFLTGTGDCPGSPNAFTWKADTNNAGSTSDPTFNFYDDGNPSTNYIIFGASAGSVPVVPSLADISGTYVATAAPTVPEPSTLILALLGGVFLLVVRRSARITS